MNERVGPISFQLKKNTDFGKKPYSDKLARMIDEVCLHCVAAAMHAKRIFISEECF